MKSTIETALEIAKNWEHDDPNGARLSVLALRIKDAILAALAEEREACAKIADSYDDSGNWADEQRFGKDAAEDIAKAIRARSTVEK